MGIGIKTDQKKSCLKIIFFSTFQAFVHTNKQKIDDWIQYCDDNIYIVLQPPYVCLNVVVYALVYILLIAILVKFAKLIVYSTYVFACIRQYWACVLWNSSKEMPNAHVQHAQVRCESIKLKSLLNLPCALGCLSIGA